MFWRLVCSPSAGVGPSGITKVRFWPRPLPSLASQVHYVGVCPARSFTDWYINQRHVLVLFLWHHFDQSSEILQPWCLPYQKRMIFWHLCLLQVYMFRVWYISPINVKIIDWREREREREERLSTLHNPSTYMCSRSSFYPIISWLENEILWLNPLCCYGGGSAAWCVESGIPWPGSRSPSSQTLIASIISVAVSMPMPLAYWSRKQFSIFPRDIFSCV